ncbi:2-succinyl-6-hydroxy-2,4-cyclohexadiene-1-carboxylate synthase [Pullulanibacillus sp. KACC 23026]|uniref:2-succinyl-6-hydroxy-2, 4-cyclohexadiene-1-carboxylate synthase n=1 Tax=Pullulanibacillus sp. KACC 23026 TaxID=3028315 RepID=UPI0023B15FF6|nr:2-succinyl-6-hydroxy-2,4-cyclohexadiene-1-carboxylate synthase [Pullulanibacillus sp. KACC 23026]WEG11982.1 2-succinyl-6-hydroxy-2,4-cyclohexadiene-1-carboxylate synthase [Pullulanibacillus sp. KACC 23026]
MKLPINSSFSLFYKVEGEGIPLLLLHGFTGTHHTWDPFVEEWKDQFQLICVDIVGHGESQVQGEDSCNSHFYTMEEMASALIKLLEHLKVNHVLVIGYSMGARLGLYFTCRHPNRVIGLVMESGSPGLKTEEERLERKRRDEELAERILNEGVLSFVNDWESIPLFETQKRLPLPVQEAVRSERLGQTAEGLAGSLRGMGTGSQPSLWEDLELVEPPVWLITGEWDKKFIDIAKEMYGRLTHVYMSIVPEAGHAVHVEQFEIFAKIIKDEVYPVIGYLNQD